MKGGKDMKKIYKFEEDEVSYKIFLKGEEKYSISKDNLKLDGAKFYDAFFAEYLIGDSIELQQGKSLDTSQKLSVSIYNTIDELLKEIIKKIDAKKDEE